jgi:hypothetical protein
MSQRHNNSIWTLLSHDAAMSFSPTLRAPSRTSSPTADQRLHHTAGGWGRCSSLENCPESSSGAMHLQTLYVLRTPYVPTGMQKPCARWSTLPFSKPPIRMLSIPNTCSSRRQKGWSTSSLVQSGYGFENPWFHVRYPMQT